MKASENSRLPWNQIQEYINIRHTDSQPGGITAYSKQSCIFTGQRTADLAADPVLPQGHSSSSITSHHDYQAASVGSSQQQQSSDFYIGANTRVQYSQPPVVCPSFGPTRQLKDTPILAGPSELLQGLDWCASEEYNEDNENSYGDDEDNVSDASGDSEKKQESGESDKSDQSGTENEEYDSQIPLLGANIRMDTPTAEKYCALQRHPDEDRVPTHLCPERDISTDELASAMQETKAELKQGLKRTRGEISDDDGIEENQNRRAKRTRRGSLGSSGLLFSGFHGLQNVEGDQAAHMVSGKAPSSPWGECECHGGSAYSSRRSTGHAAGSAVQRLHHDRLRRPAPKETQDEAHVFSYCPKSDLTIGDQDYVVYNLRTGSQQPPYAPEQGYALNNRNSHANISQPQSGLGIYRSQQEYDRASNSAYADAGAPQIRPLSRHQQQPGSEQDISSTQGQTPRGPSQIRVSSSAVTQARTRGVHTVPHRAYQQAIASAARDDPFFSDELFNGMLNGQPDNNHVGSMYTCSQQQETDEYHRRQMMPRPRPGTVSNALADSGPSPLSFSVLDGAVRQADRPDLIVGDMAGWNVEWEGFINGHDAEPLLRALCQDEHSTEEDEVGKA